MSTLFLVGSGPGDPELLTLKACKVIKSAQIILFDNLVDQKILELAPKNCINKFVGKIPYGEQVSQEEINDLIAFYCSRYQRVVRLKGGDPYLFGRGFEEWLHAKRLSIDVQYIPGISAMQGAGLTNIPLTHRGVSNGVWALTATNKDKEFSSDLTLAAQSTSTVVIYMGMSKLAQIARTYVMQGKADRPATIVQYASRIHQKHVICRVADLVTVSKTAGLGHPAIIIIGEVVNLQQSLPPLNQIAHVI